MRLHRLRITAFGPYPDTQEIDFDALCDAGLFLIHGATGAGKTSVLDAVCFALYGRVPSVRDAAKNLRSDHAAPDQGPEVVLEVTIRGRRLRITRSPAWQRPKRRGTGFTEEKAKALVEEQVGTGEWIGRSNRSDEVGHLIGTLLGMSSDQFFQVVLLPQGDFARFLRATAEERRKVLEKLFATEVFTQVEKWLGDRGLDSRHRVDEAVRVATEVADRAAEAAAVSDRPDLEPDGLAAWIVEVGAELGDVLAATEELAGEAGRVLVEARAADAQGRALADLRRRHAEATARGAGLAARAAERTTLTSTLAAAARAERVLPLIRNVRDRTRRADAAAAAVRTALVPLDGLVADATDPEVLRKEERERRDELVSLDQLRGEAAQLTDLDRKHRTLRIDLKKAEQVDAALAATIAELPGRLDGLQRELTEARNAEAKLPGVEAAVDDLRRRLTAARRRDALTTELAVAQDDRRAAIDVAQSTKDRLQRLRQRRLDGMAAALAADLSAGEPCRVCGSTEHPAPAEPGDLPTVEDEEAAAEADEAAQERREETELTVATRRAELDAEIANAGDAEADLLHEELAETQERLTELGELAVRTAELNERVGVVKNELEDAGLQRTTVGQLIAEAVTELRALAEVQERLGAKLDEARGQDATLAARVDRIAGEAELFGVAAGALDAERTAVDELGDARAAARTAAADEGFDGAAAAEDAVLPAARVAALTADLKSFDDEAAAVAGLLDDPDLMAAAAQHAPDLDRLAAGLAEADGCYSAVRSALDRARVRRDRLAELAAEAARAVAGWRPAADRHEIVHHLAELVRGTSADNEARMKLSAYVLGARLGQVVTAANDRLGTMSGGRFALEHSDERSAGDRSRSGGGLGLRIADNWTGVSRDPATLSGGESFITSLALALGLADVVTAEAGGAEIGVLFVDEGFGTLDEETLDEVMAVLDGLRDGGRAVGVVSHVAELRVRIPAQLRVHKDRHGSRVSVSA